MDLVRTPHSIVSAFAWRSRATLLLASSLAFTGLRSSEAMTASPWPFEETQPDGTRIELYVRGGEDFHWLCDPRGFTVVRNQGWFVFAARDLLGGLNPTALRVGRDDPAAHGLRPHQLPAPERRPVSPLARLGDGPSTSATSGEAAPPPPPPGGFATPASRRNLVVLLRFSDHAARVLPSESDVDVLMNAVGGDATLAPTGSVRDAYLQFSYGRLAIDSTIAYWVTLPNTESYYANGNRGLTTRTHEALKFALDALEADPGFSFLPFDENHDGAIDAITFLHSGYGAEWGGTSSDGAYYMNRIWSHKWSISGGWQGSEGVRVTNYHISPALWGKSGSTIGRIGVICHETGHFLGLPDLYDGGDSDGDGRVGEGLGSYCLMANSWGFDGSQRFPPHPSAWAKQQLGWIAPGRVTGPGSFGLRQAELYPDAWRIDLGYPTGEYLLVENRQRIGLDSVLPQGGLAIYHVDDSTGYTAEGHPWQTGWPANGRHYRVALLPADGTYDLERGLDRGDGTDVFHGTGVRELGPNTTGTQHPNTDAYQGGVVMLTGNRLFNISASGATMTFDFEQVGHAPALPIAPSSLTAVAASATRIELTWQDQSSNEDAFAIERSLDNVAFAEIARTSADTTTFSDTTCAAATTYYYRVRACRETLSSDPSNTVSAVTPQPPLSPPSNLRGLAQKNLRINLAWRDNSTNETGFRIERAIDPGFSLELRVMNIAADRKSFADSRLTEGVTYFYRVSAFNDSTVSTPCSPVSVVAIR